MSGISCDRAYRLERKLIERLADVFATSLQFRSTSETISARIVAIRESAEWKRAPRHVHTYCEGYIRARRDEFYRTHLEWMLWFDGRLIRDRALIPKGRWNEVDGERSRHVYLGHAECPFDAKWVGQPF